MSHYPFSFVFAGIAENVAGFDCSIPAGQSRLPRGVAGFAGIADLIRYL